MADKYLSYTGSNTYPYESATTAATTLQTILGSGVYNAGERIYVNGTPDNYHTETYTAAQTFTSPTWATPTTPAQLICVSDFFTASPPVAVVSAPTARIITSGGAFNMTFNGRWHIDGIAFYPGNKGANTSSLFFDVYYLVGRNIKIVLPSGGSAFGRFGPGGGGGIPSTVFVKDVYYSPTHTSNILEFGKGRIFISGLRFDASESGVVAPNRIFQVTGGSPCVFAEVCDSDFSALAYGAILSTSNAGTGEINFVRCKLRPGAGIVSPYSQTMPRVRLLDCDSGNTNIRYEVHDSAGTIVTDTTIYPASDPATDGSTRYSHYLSTNSNASYFLPLYTDWVERWVDGGITVEPRFEVLLGGSGAPPLTNRDLFIEVEYQHDSSSPLGRTITNRPDVLTAGTTLPSGTVAWVGHGFSSPTTHKVSAGPITPNKSGFVRARLGVSIASTSLYYDPQIRW